MRPRQFFATVNPTIWSTGTHPKIQWHRNATVCSFWTIRSAFIKLYTRETENIFSRSLNTLIGIFTDEGQDFECVINYFFHIEEIEELMVGFEEWVFGGLGRCVEVERGKHVDEWWTGNWRVILGTDGMGGFWFGQGRIEDEDQDEDADMDEDEDVFVRDEGLIIMDWLIDWLMMTTIRNDIFQKNHYGKNATFLTMCYPNEII